MDDDFTVTTEDVDIESCWRLLGRAWIGRVAFVDDDGPAALPVNCGVKDHTIVFRTASTSSLHALGIGAAVAFEVDHTDRVAEAGWSVLVRGHLWTISKTEDLDALHEIPLHPWVEGRNDRWMRIVPTSVTGRITSRHRRQPLAPGISRIPPD